MVAVAPSRFFENGNRNDVAPAQAMPTDQQRETAQYVADMILELRNMAKALQLYTIPMPLVYAYNVAFSVANRVMAPADEVERLKELSRLAESDQHS